MALTAGRDSAMTPDEGTRETRRLGAAIVTGVLVGVGIAGFIDESIFHQLLQWHNFYWATDERGRILSDGLFHIGSTLVLLWGAWRLWRDRASGTPLHARAIVGGILLGAGGFNAYDGIVQHVILHLHLVNEHVCASPMDPHNSILSCRADIPFEVVWIGVGVLVLVTGIVLARQSLTQGRSGVR
jgi:uncharacterized membrane protein